MSQDYNPQQAQHLLNQLVFDFMKQQKNQRRWVLFKRIIYVLIFGFFIFSMVSSFLEEKSQTNHPHVGVIDLKGEISDRSLMNADAFAKSIAKAYKNNMMKALIIRINSPGGSPVQADYMFNTLRYYRKRFPEIKTYAVCVDSCASAAYYVAAGSDEIYANPASLVGSIGVIYDGFGFPDLMQKLGISRRLVTAGKNKGFLDPFSPVSPEQKQILENMLQEIHQQFIDKVKLGRGQRLKINQDTFSGLAWTGTKAKDMGLVDGFASAGELMRDKIKLNTAIDYTEKMSVVEQVSRNVGSSFNLSLQEILHHWNWF
jgi:protease-4